MPAVRAAIAAVCERLAAATYAEVPAPSDSNVLAPEPLPSADGRRTITTRRGRIIALPAVSASRARVATWAERAVWMGVGLALGITAIGLTLAFAHRLNGHDNDT
jgi:hypothetical protein